MKTVFDPVFQGLQIDWHHDREVEFIGPAVLKGLAFNTAATCKLKNKVISYVYPITASRAQGTLTLEYRTSPFSWPSQWEAVPGKLTIEFADDASLEPAKVTWWNEDTSESSLLERGKEWVYVGPPTVPVVLKVRGRLHTLRLQRPAQQALRNKLISTFASCQITDTRCLSTLEACHIVPVGNGGDDSMANALLLRRDLHALFDAGLLRLRQETDSWSIELDPRVTDRCYQSLRKLSLPADRFRLNTPYLLARAELELRSVSADKVGS